MKNKIVIYTVIFGQYDLLQEPEYIPQDVDFICFTDQPFKSKVWSIRNVQPPFPLDLTRSNRFYKLLAHKFLPEYEHSVYVDGNLVVTGDLVLLIKQYLNGANFAAFDCALYSYLPSSSVAEQAQRLLRPGQEERNGESYENIIRQLETYKKEGFPDNNGCIMGMMLIRRHNKEDVVKAMEAWWHEVQTKSKRDLMSFNYVAWKLGFAFNYIPIDGSNNQFVKKMRHFKPLHSTLLFRCKSFIKRLLKISKIGLF